MGLSVEQKKAAFDLRLIDNRKIGHFRIDQGEKHQKILDGMANGSISYNPADLGAFFDELHKKELPKGDDGAL